MAQVLGWLVEWPQSFDVPGPMPPRWWHCGHGWVLDANEATRFCREQDAINYFTYHNMKWAKATAHTWIDGACAECHGAGEYTHPEGGPQYECGECRGTGLNL